MNQNLSSNEYCSHKVLQKKFFKNPQFLVTGDRRVGSLKKKVVNLINWETQSEVSLVKYCTTTIC